MFDGGCKRQIFCDEMHSEMEEYFLWCHYDAIPRENEKIISVFMARVLPALI